MLLNVLRYMEPLRQRSIQPQNASQTKAEKPCITASPEHWEAETSGDAVTAELRRGVRGSGLLLAFAPFVPHPLLPQSRELQIPPLPLESIFALLWSLDTIEHPGTQDFTLPLKELSKPFSWAMCLLNLAISVDLLFLFCLSIFSNHYHHWKDILNKRKQ